MTVFTGGWQLAPDYDSNALIADVGLYTGPWPPATRLVQNLPLDAGEIDYLVAIPNPNGVVDDVANGRYPTCWRDVGMFWTGSPGGPIDTFDTHTRSAGGAPLVEAVPPGAHLFILWYGVHFGPAIDLPQPSVAPLAVVPKGWCQGARGWGQGPPQWSDWQPPYGYVDVLGPSNFFLNGQHGGAVPFTPPGGVAEATAQYAALGAGGAIWDDGGAPFGSSFFFQIETSVGSGDSQAAMTYEAVDYNAGVIEAAPPQIPPPVFPSAAIPIPPDLRNAATVDLYQYESASTTFTSWLDAIFAHVALNVSTNDGAGNPAFVQDPGPVGFTPPAEAPWSLGVLDPITPTGSPYAADPLSDGHYYIGPHLAPTTMTPLSDFAVPAISVDRTSAPYTNNGSSLNEVLLPSVSVDIPFSAISRKSFALMVVSSYLTGTPLPLTGAPFSHATDRGGNMTASLSQYPGDDPTDPLSFFAGRYISANFRSPRWRYLHDGALIPPADTSYLRLNQRTDGLGISGHPRLTATQAPHAPRVGGKNTYQ